MNRILYSLRDAGQDSCVVARQLVNKFRCQLKLRIRKNYSTLIHSVEIQRNSMKDTNNYQNMIKLPLCPLEHCLNRLLQFRSESLQPKYAQIHSAKIMDLRL